MQREISSRHFSELLAYRNRNTLSPDVWWANAVSASFVTSAIGGRWVDPRLMIPGQVDPEKWSEFQTRAAERDMDRNARKAEAD